MIRINQTVLLGLAVVTFSLLSIAFADETPPSVTVDQKEILCVMPAEANDSANKPNIKKMSAEECEKAGGKPAIPHGPKPKD